MYTPYALTNFPVNLRSKPTTVGEPMKAQPSSMMSKLERLLLRLTKRMVVMPPPMLLPRPRPRTTASLMKSTLLNSPRRSSPLVPVSQRPVRQMKVASKTRSGQPLSLSPRRRKKTLLPDPEERPSANVSASKSKSLTSINVSKKPQNVVDAVAPVDSVVAVAAVETVEMDHPEAEVAEEVVVMETVDAVDVVAREGHTLLAAAHATTPLAHRHPSTPRIPRLSQAWEHKSYITRFDSTRQPDFVKYLVPFKGS